jgi:UMF1 family MFS transporter
MNEDGNKRTVFSWVLYDWANSAFTTTVVAGFFPVFFKQYLNPGVDAATSTFRLGAANSIASLVVALLSPMLGAIADRGGARKKFLVTFAMLGVVMTGALHFARSGHWELAVLIYIAASIGFSSASSFYDSLLVGVAPPGRRDYVSSLGFAYGYLGGGVLFAVNVAMTARPELFGFRDAEEAIRVSFLTVALWWAAFSVPLVVFVKDTPGRTTGYRRAIAGGLHQLRRTFAEIRKLKMVFLFLAGYWCYIDGVDTITRMAVDFGLSLGFDATHLVVALLITQFVGFPAAIAFGKLGQARGAKTGIYIAIVVYIAVCVWASRMQDVWEFYALAVAIGLVLGGVQSLSRSFFSRIIPRDKTAQFFGFYNMLGRFAAVIGPFLIGSVGVLAHSPRVGILSVIVLLVVGALLIARVDEKTGTEAARELEGA